MLDPRPNVTAPSELRALLAEYDVRPAKRLGQSFLIDANVVAKILATASIGSDDDVFEVGPGAGALTVALAGQAGQVVALELDRRLVELLRHLLGGAANVRIERGDILKADLRALLGGGTWKALANLPYSVVGPAVMRLIAYRELFPLMVLMVQREMAERLAASPNNKQYGVISVQVQAYVRVEVVGQVSRTCFHPQPQVDSTLMRLTRLQRPAVAADSEATFTAVVRGVFRQRRKTIFNALILASELGLDRERVQRALDAAAIGPMRRPGSLSVAEFAALVGALRASHTEMATAESAGDGEPK